MKEGADPNLINFFFIKNGPDRFINVLFTTTTKKKDLFVAVSWGYLKIPTKCHNL